MNSEFFGIHVRNTEIGWPPFPVTAQRLWDSNTAWPDIEPSSGSRNWTQLDGQVARAMGQKAFLLYTCGRTPQWAARDPRAWSAYGPGQSSPPLDFATWEQFITEVVVRHKTRIRAYELWNEPFTGPLVPPFWSGTADELLDFCRKTAMLIRRLDPAALIVSPGFVDSTGARTFIDRGGADFCDVVAVHGYMPPGNEHHLVSRMNLIRSALDARGQQDKPIWMTEWSWGKDSTVPSYIEQAQILAKTLILFAALKVERAFWYGWGFSEWGILHDPTGERLAAHVYRATATALLPLSPLSARVLSQNVIDCQFVDPARRDQVISARWTVGDQRFPAWS